MRDGSISRCYNVELAPHKHWRTAYALVEQEAKEFLETLASGERVTTTALVEILYDETFQQPVIKKRVFKALHALQTRELRDYCTRGEPEKIGNVENARRTYWHKPTGDAVSAKSVCPTCRRAL